MLPTPNPEIDSLIRHAIERKRLLQLRYQNRERIVEPHDYGVKDGFIKLFVFQVGGSSSHALPNWRMLFVEKISQVRLLDQSFPGARDIPSGAHQKWDVLFARVKLADQKSKVASNKK